MRSPRIENGLIGIVMGILLLLRPLNTWGLIIMGLHYLVQLRGV